MLNKNQKAFESYMTNTNYAGNDAAPAERVVR